MLYVMGEPGLRERKKARTRQRISDVATYLFMVRGFDNVSVAEIAEAAEVSKMTVFNYFPRKEDLMLDRHPETIELITDAIRGRDPGEPPLAALRRLLIELAQQRHPVSGVRDGTQQFFRTVLDSPALLARLREQQEELENVLAGLLAEASGTEQSPQLRLVAAWVTAVHRAAYSHAMQRLLAGELADDITGDHIALLNRSFDALEQAAAVLCAAR